METKMNVFSKRMYFAGKTALGSAKGKNVVGTGYLRLRDGREFVFDFFEKRWRRIKPGSLMYDISHLCDKGHFMPVSEINHEETCSLECDTCIHKSTCVIGALDECAKSIKNL